MAKAHGKVDGRMVVLVLFAGALLLWGIVLMTGIRKRDGRGNLEGSPSSAVPRDSSAHPDTLRSWVSRLPGDWVKVTKVEGQGFVLLVPCYTPNSALSLRGPADSLPQLTCEYCDSLGRYGIIAIAKDRNDSTWELHLNPPAGELRILAVTDSLLKRFPEAPFQDRILVWTRPRQAARSAVPDTAPAIHSADASADTMVFVPKAQENEFEVLRAEDENPEGCGAQAE